MIRQQKLSGGETIGQLMSYSEPAPALTDRYARDSLGERSTTAPAMVEAGGAPIELSIIGDLALVEEDWRAFEQEADCTVFQTFAWQSAWMRSIAPHQPVTPAVVVGRSADRRILFLIPLAIHRQAGGRSLTWLASDVCDYNAPLLARDFTARFGSGRFPGLWREILGLLKTDQRLRPDVVILEKMPATVGSQPNPFMELDVSANPSRAYLTHLTGDWTAFYSAKRSSATRRRDRTKLKRLADLGEVRFVTTDSPDAINQTLSALYAQKAKSFARMGVANIFARSGWADFFRRLATDPASRHLVHVSRIEVGDTLAATNFGLIFDGCYYHILAGYDDGEVSKYGPGAAHLRDLMRYAIEQGCDTFDFTIGDEAYKRDWADTVIDLHDLRSALTWRGAVVAFPSAMQARAKRAIKQTPWLWSLATRFRAALGKRGTPRPEAGGGEDVD